MSHYQQISNKIQLIKIKSGRKTITWINIYDAGKDEIEYLRKKYKFKLKHLQKASAKAMAQRTMLENTDDYLFMIMHFPIYAANTIVPGEIVFFVNKSVIVTIHDNNISTVNSYFNLLKKDGEEIKKHGISEPSNLLYLLMERLMHSCYSLLDQNSVQIAEMEDIIFDQERQKKAVGNILHLQRNIINTRRIMQNHKNIIKKSIDYFDYKKNKDLREEFKDLLDSSKRFWENLENQKEMVEVLSATNDALLNYHISDIMKTLTLFSVIVFPLTLLAAIFGMNTVKGMPFMETENGFWVIIGIMLFGCLAMLLFFVKKKWL